MSGTTLTWREHFLMELCSLQVFSISLALVDLIVPPCHQHYWLPYNTNELDSFIVDIMMLFTLKLDFLLIVACLLVYPSDCGIMTWWEAPWRADARGEWREYDELECKNDFVAKDSECSGLSYRGRKVVFLTMVFIIAASSFSWVLKWVKGWIAY